MNIFLGYSSSLSILIPFILLLLANKQLTKGSLLIQIYIIVGVLTETINVFPKSQLNNYTSISSNIFAVIEVILILLALYQWSLNYKNKYVFITLLSIYIFIWFYSIHLNGINKLSSIINGTEALIIITASIYFLYNKFISENASNAKWQTTFSIAFLYYFLVNSGIYSFTELFLNIEQPQNWIYFSWIHLIGNFGLNIILALGIYQCRKQSSMA
jgi:hypothetical protein